MMVLARDISQNASRHCDRSLSFIIQPVCLHIRLPIYYTQSGIWKYSVYPTALESYTKKIICTSFLVLISHHSKLQVIERHIRPRNNSLDNGFAILALASPCSLEGLNSLVEGESNGGYIVKLVFITDLNDIPVRYEGLEVDLASRYKLYSKFVITRLWQRVNISYC